jgi:hypothetical protein
MSAYTDWAPKEFDESAIEARAEAPPNKASESAAGDGAQQSAGQSDEAGASQAQSGFVYDSSSGPPQMHPHDTLSRAQA